MDEPKSPLTGLSEFNPTAGKELLNVESRPSFSGIDAPEGFYIIAYKLISEKNGKNRYIVTDHKNIDRFIQQQLAFAVRTYDIKIVEKSSDYLEANSIATILTLEENFEGGVKKFRLGGILMAKYSLKEIFSNDTLIKKYPI